MHHLLGEAIKDEDPTKLYKVIQEHFIGGKNHHVESARRKLNAHRFGPDIERDISRLLVLISELEVAQRMDMPECQKFGILRNIIGHEERPYVKNLFGMASYMKETFYNTVMKNGTQYRRTRAKLRWRPAWRHKRRTEFVLSIKQTSELNQSARSFTRS